VSALHLIVIAKSPVAGRSKTRLCPPYSLEEAAQIAEAALTDTLETVAETPAMARTLVLDGTPGPWLPNGFTVIPQRGNGLDERLAAAFEDAEQLLPGPMLLIGMDTPQVTRELLVESGEALKSDGTHAVLGPASDGGWWALGLHHANADLLTGVPMSTAHTYSAQHRRLVDHGMLVGALPELIDVDNSVSAIAVADLIPGSRFSRSLAVLASVR
jgi:hypothetical protein